MCGKDVRPRAKTPSAFGRSTPAHRLVQLSRPVGWEFKVEGLEFAV